MNFVLCACYKNKSETNPGIYCTNWDGKGSATERTIDVRSKCELEEVNPENCEFASKPKPREGIDWFFNKGATVTNE